jgi:hypothetical protein
VSGGSQGNEVHGGLATIGAGAQSNEYDNGNGNGNNEDAANDDCGDNVGSMSLIDWLSEYGWNTGHGWGIGHGWMGGEQ